MKRSRLNGEGCTWLLEVDDHLMEALGRHIMKAWRDHGRGSSLGSGTSFYKTGRPFLEDATSHSYRIEAFRLT